MAASPAIDLREPLAALFKRAGVADILYRRYEGRLAELGVGDAGDLLEEVAEKGIGSLDIHDRQAEKLRRALLGPRGWGDAAAAAEGGSGGGTEGSSLDPLEPALPESGDGTIAAEGGEEERPNQVEEALRILLFPLNVGQWLGVVEPCCLCGRPGSAGELWRAGAWRWANSTGRCAAPYLATTDDRWGVPGLRQAYVAHGMCGGLCQGWGCCEARGVAQPQDGSGEARGEGEGEGELSSDGDSDRSAGDPVWGSAALEDEWRAASLARQAVGDAAYAAAHAAGASRAEACDAAVRAVRLDEDWEGEERPEEYAGLFDDP
ncbi:hypothetical protein EMIHUDRAFT_451842 [Emiliania huxleyi CCMP1516]|uniref:SAM domain-containing protein n=2 Tax=Emiliania huxleyi TaxID=2903 RepID=A0A0D3IS15_EMIH1|nr:hypothetical protein EMIHUDRAFT_451842 [Emiliania huxleyi CCMP1516]EOD14050.1 hypothetical protein EMIHUDRAFT_451842 [Emiliania huxleyi CCMP1516]|eukprot:XP_005766479.1 hypothetical protein EMIHUDRAFT_451842 [Emiliania huxleyi CCMP1516]